MNRDQATTVFDTMRQQRPIYQQMYDAQIAMTDACQRLAPLTETPDVYLRQADTHIEQAQLYSDILTTIDDALRFKDGMN